MILRAASINIEEWPLTGNGGLQIDTHGFSLGLQLADFVAQMQAEGLNFYQDDPVDSDLYPDVKWTVIRFEGGAEAYFYSDEETNSELVRIRLEKAPTKKPKLKQISISLPEDAYERIRLKATQENRRSISKICSTWILDNLEDLIQA
ncbi:MAG: hypothetical protein K0U98_17625 [Deltaproteobacteria bacterium]|nr:hypothetical protein [Deltaproteobacteria bacterium]